MDRTPSGRAVADGTIVDPAALTLTWIDPAAQWGLGIFETIAVRDGAPAHWEAHRARLEAAAARCGIPLPAEGALDRAIRTVSEGIAGGHGWSKILVSRSGRWAAFAGVSDPAHEGNPVSAIVLSWKRHRQDVLAGMKSLAYAGSILGLEEARRRGADEGLILNDRGHVVEGCTSNIFIVKGRAAVTPALSEGARDGVTRERAIAALHAVGISVRQSKLRVDRLRVADEVFLTSSLQGIRPVILIDGRNVANGKPGSVTMRVVKRLTPASAPQEVEDHA
jgi:branched-subunit amino acid aminotransferase/4-amino-4-deoxychorismate lyase